MTRLLALVMVLAGLALPACGGGGAASAGAGAAAAANGTGTAPTGLAVYVNSASGNDANDGSAARPIKTLGQLAKLVLPAGSTVQLACGSTWAETLAVNPQSGGAAGGIAVGPDGNCAAAAAPTVDGAQTVNPSSWQAAAGQPGVYVASVSARVMQVALDGDVAKLPQAHFPAGNSTGAYYLPVAADSNGHVIAITPSDLPADAVLDATTTLHVRNNNWTIAERQVDARSTSIASGSVALLDYSLLADGSQSTDYPPWDPSNPNATAIYKGWGYYLSGNVWMLNHAPGWVYVAPTGADPNGKLYVRLPDGSAPSQHTLAFTTLALGINLAKLQNVSVSGVVVRNTFTGADLSGSSNVSLANISWQNIANNGIVLGQSSNASISQVSLNRVGRNGVLGSYDKGTQVLGSVFNDVGVFMDQEAVLSLPLKSVAAILLGPQATVRQNQINNTGYAGIMFAASPGTVVSGNVVQGACTVLTDCGAIFTGGSSTTPGGGQIMNNLVNNVRQATQGLPPGGTSAAVGVYVDDLGTGFVVTGNVVIGADYGIQLHRANHNTVQSNTLVGNRNAQLWLQDNQLQNGTDSGLTNLIANNLIVPSSATQYGVRLETLVAASTTGMAVFKGNFYYDLPLQSFFESWQGGWRAQSFADWQATTTDGTPNGQRRGWDATGTAASTLGLTPLSLGSSTPSNLVPNVARWNWNSPNGGGTVAGAAGSNSGDPAGLVLAISPALVLPAADTWAYFHLPPVPVVKGQWYRLSADMWASVAVPNRQFSLGGCNNPQGLMDLNGPRLTFAAGPKWQRYAMYFKASANCAAADPYIYVSRGETAKMANVEIVPIDAMDQRVFSLVNAVGTSPVAMACPSPDPNVCAHLVLLTDLVFNHPGKLPAPAQFPVSVAPHSAVILAYVNRDSDGDGIPDTAEQPGCQNTAYGQMTNSAGCPFAVGVP